MILLTIVVSLQLLAIVPCAGGEYLHITDSGFTTLPSSVRAMGMGEAFVAVADDYSACYFNPAGLIQITRKEVETM